MIGKLTPILLLMVISCGSEVLPSECEEARLVCRAEYVKERPFSAHTLFRHCSNDYGTCVGSLGAECEEACVGTHDPNRRCEPSYIAAGGYRSE